MTSGCYFAGSVGDYEATLVVCGAAVRPPRRPPYGGKHTSILPTRGAPGGWASTSAGPTPLPTGSASVSDGSAVGLAG